MQIEKAHGDLLEQSVEAIVNAWNRNIIPWWLLLPQGVSRAIKKRGGYAPFRELARHGPIPLGGAVVTGAGRLPYKAIIHVAGINLFWVATERSIRESARNAVGAANAHGFRSLAFPAIGADRKSTSERAPVALIPIDPSGSCAKPCVGCPTTSRCCWFGFPNSKKLMIYRSAGGRGMV